MPGADLLALWLWEAPQLNHLVDPNVFEFFYSNIRRIPEYKNEEFFRKKVRILKRLIGGFGKEPYRSFLDYVEHDPYLKEIYDQEQYVADKKWISQRLWEYTLRILPPIGTGITELLRFHVAVHRLSPGNEFLAVYEPHPTSNITAFIIERKYNEVTTMADMIGYVQYKKDVDKYQESRQEEDELPIIRKRARY